MTIQISPIDIIFLALCKIILTVVMTIIDLGNAMYLFIAIYSFLQRVNVQVSISDVAFGERNS